MDTSETYAIMCEKATEILDSHKLKAVDPNCKCKEEYYLDNTDFYAIHSEDGYWYCSNLAQDYVGNYSVIGYVKRPQDRFGCSVRTDLPKVFDYLDVIWLPRQDQLQKMLNFPIGNFNDNFWTALGELHDWGFTIGNFKDWIPVTMEQLWLAFVMHKKYQKIWNGENWVNTGKIKNV